MVAPIRSGFRREWCGEQDGARPSEGGFVAVEWIGAMVLLLFPVLFIGAGVSRWPERQEVARAAAAEAARAAVLADDPLSAELNARAVASQVATNYGVDPDQVIVEVSVQAWEWGQSVRVKVTTPMPSLDVPGVGSWSATNWSVEVSQRIESHRGLG